MKYIGLDFPFFTRFSSKKDYLSLFVQDREFLCHGREFFPKFQEGSILQLKTFPGEITGFSRRTAESAFFKSRTQRDNGSVNWASYGILLLGSGSGLILADSYGLSSRCSVMLKSKSEAPLFPKFKGFEHGQDLKRNVRRPQTV